MFLPLRNAEIISVVSSALSQKCSGSSYPYIRNGFFKLSVIQEVSNITQIALRKLRNKNTIFLSYHQTFSSRFFEFYLLHTDFLFCPELSNYRILSSHGVSRTVTDFSFLVPNFRIIEFCLHTEYRRQSRIFLFFLFLSRIIEFQSHGISRTVTDFLFFFLSRIIELSNFIFLVPRLVLCPELSNFCLL